MSYPQKPRYISQQLLLGGMLTSISKLMMMCTSILVGHLHANIFISISIENPEHLSVDVTFVLWINLNIGRNGWFYFGPP